MLFLLTIYTLCDSSDLKYGKQREYFILKTEDILRIASLVDYSLVPVLFEEYHGFIEAPSLGSVWSEDWVFG